MIQKIIQIANVGHFVNFKFHGSKQWNGQFMKLNIVYAPNGSGKTTLATIFKSLAEKDAGLLKFKRTFGTQSDPTIKIQSSDNRLLVFDDGAWSPNKLKIEVFDINYIEEYLFAGSLVGKKHKTNLFKLFFGQKGAEFRNKMKPAIREKESMEKRLSRNEGRPEWEERLKKAKEELHSLIIEFDEYTKPIYATHVQLINKYLAMFTSYIKLAEFASTKTFNDFERFRIYPVLDVYGEKVVFESPNTGSKFANARYSLSEGDKSTVALCFFLARLEFLGVEDRIVVFDDPLSSFDYSRRNTTIHRLAKVATSSIQFFLLTHDLAFAADFSDKCAFINQITLKIGNNGKSSFLCAHDFRSEFLTSTQKDIRVITEFLDQGASSDLERREVIRCIRPVLEGVFKSKYFDIIPINMWLGDIIELISKSNPGNKLNKLKSILDELIELNDFTKSYHHSAGNSRDLPIDPEELRRYVVMLMIVIERV